MQGQELPVPGADITGDAIERVLRIKSISITNFRGIKKQENLDVDADIVLLTGPNGFGKTSFIEALCLMLTGHHYYGNNPKAILFLKNGEHVGPAVIKAEADVLKKSEEIVKQEIKVEIPTSYSNEPLPFTGFNPYKSPIQPEINARASFFYQELLRELFDEETPYITLKEFLVPVEKEIVEIPKKIKALEKKLVEKEKQLFDIGGIPSVDEIERQRKEAVKDFICVWNGISQTIEMYGVSLPKRSENWLFMLKSDNLRQGWEGELRKLANDCLQSLAVERMEPLPGDAKPVDSLKRLVSLVPVIDKKLTEGLEKVQQVKRLISSLPQGCTIPEQGELPAMKQAIEETRQELEKLRDRLAAVSEVFRCYSENEGSALLDILKALRKNGKAWIDNATKVEGWHLPEPVTRWLNTVLENLCSNGHCLDDVFGEWLNRIEKEMSSLKENIQEKEQSIRTRQELVDKIEKIYELAAQSEEARALVDKEKNRKQGPEVGEALPQPVDSIYEESHLSEDPITALKMLETAIGKWINVEKLSIEREDRLRKIEGTREARQIINEVREAIKNESSKRSSLLETILELPAGEIQRLEDLLNDVFFRFRTVKGLYPVKLERGQRGTGRSRREMWEIRTGDKRPFQALSTGQKAQLGLSFLVSLNIALERLIRHNIIGLDDTTTALDMAQLPREAVLLRQIAYGAQMGDCSFKSRRQIFIVSHHEDLTHRLIDFLIPPAGRDLCILNFVDWRPDKGPEIERFKVEAANAMDRKTRERFAEQIKLYVRSMK